MQACIPGIIPLEYSTLEIPTVEKLFHSHTTVPSQDCAASSELVLPCELPLGSSHLFFQERSLFPGACSRRGHQGRVLAPAGLLDVGDLLFVATLQFNLRTSQTAAITRQSLLLYTLLWVKLLAAVTDLTSFLRSKYELKDFAPEHSDPREEELKVRRPKHRLVQKIAPSCSAAGRSSSAGHSQRP